MNPTLTGFEPPVHLRSSVEPARPANHREHATRLLRELLDVNDEPLEKLAHEAREGRRLTIRRESFEIDVAPEQAHALLTGNVIGEDVVIANGERTLEIWGYTGRPAGHDSFQPGEWTDRVHWAIHATARVTNLKFAPDGPVIEGRLELEETYET